MSKKRVAFFDFASCEGCQLQMANFGEAFLDVLNLMDVVMFREVMSEKTEDYDVAIVEGSITTPYDVERIRHIRQRAKVVIALGSCATIGGVNGMKNNFGLEEIRAYVYGDKASLFPTIPTLPLHEVIEVDYYVHGCPIYQPEFLKILKHALRDIPYTVKDEAVCVECKYNENECMFEKGLTCLGPVTMAGCNAWCINQGNICYGCRGLVGESVLEGCRDVLEKYHIPLDWIKGKMNMYNTGSISRPISK